jgi:hypothetical protein
LQLTQTGSIFDAAVSWLGLQLTRKYI